LALALLGASTFAMGCGDDSATDTPPEPTGQPDPDPDPDPEPEPEPVPPLLGTDDLADLDDADNIPDAPDTAGPVGVSPETAAAATPAHGCVLLSDTTARVYPRTGQATAVASGDTFLIVGYARGENSGEQLFVVSATPDGAPTLVRTLPIAVPSQHARTAPPAAALLSDGRLYVAWLDGPGAVYGAVMSAQPGGSVRPTALGTGADTRFAPAVLVAGEHVAVAWTEASTPMRLKLATVEPGTGEVASEHDLTPTNIGAAAPTVVHGAARPTLLFLDPRAGTSPLFQVSLGADATPGRTRPARPVGNASEPPRLASATVGPRTHGGYTAVGSGATSAIGYVTWGDAEASPVAIVPGTGYGRLWLSAAAAPGAALFAASAPTGTDRESLRVVRVRVADEAGLGELLELPGHGRMPAIARRADGVVGVALARSDSMHVAWLRCDDR
jgi:hypothetical protein